MDPQRFQCACMRRWFFNVVAGICVILLGATVVLWLRSAQKVDYVQWTDKRHFPGLVSSGGRIIWSYQFFPNGAGGNTPGWTMGSWQGAYWKAPDPADPNTWADSRNYFLGFEWSPRAGRASNRGPFIRIATPTTFVAAVPHWFICLLVSLVMLQWVRVQRRRRRLGENHCSNCGYDLRASVGRCPECGRAIGGSATAAAAASSGGNP